MAHNFIISGIKTLQSWKYLILYRVRIINLKRDKISELDWREGSLITSWIELRKLRHEVKLISVLSPFSPPEATALSI